ncbi:MAG: hypothetical protein WAR79_06365 [Melioribacteraceae bacterium]
MFIYQLTSILGSDSSFNIVTNYTLDLSIIQKSQMKFFIIRLNPPTDPMDITSSFVDGFSAYLVFDESLSQMFIPLLSKTDAKPLNKLPDFNTFSFVDGNKEYMLSIIGK